MLKKIVIVMAVLAVASPAFAYRVGTSWSQVDQGKILVEKDDAGNIIGFAEGYTPPNDRTVDWEKGDSQDRQRKAEVWNWPATYDYVPVANINVRMEIGFWIQLQGCTKSDKYLDLKQYMINKYRGYIECTASANVATEWKASWTKTMTDMAMAKEFVNVSTTSGSTSDGATAKFADKIKDQKFYVGLGLKEVDLYKNAPTPSGSCVTIGYVTVSVRPTVKPNQFMSGCMGKGAGYMSPTYGHYAPPTGL